ncbi:MAG: 8-oxo-dGTP diphosphatase [Rhodoglobus sp.]
MIEPTLPGMYDVCVVYILRSQPDGTREVLLGRKKTGLGIGHFVAPGGKLEAGESPVDAAVREVEEEVGLTLDAASLRLVGELIYPFPHKPQLSQRSWVFLADAPDGEPVESNELVPEWMPVAELPLDAMWDDAKHWLPQALDGVEVRATFVFGPDALTVESSDYAGYVPRAPIC